MKPGEEDGIYNFLTRAEFEVLIGNNEMLEYSLNDGSYYGILTGERTTINIRLERNDKGIQWGFAFGLNEKSDWLEIADVLQDGAAWNKLCIGDRIKAINSEDLTDMYHQDCLDIVLKAELSLTLTVERCANQDQVQSFVKVTTVTLRRGKRTDTFGFEWGTSWLHLGGHM